MGICFKCMCVLIYIYMYIYIHTHTHTHTLEAILNVWFKILLSEEKKLCFHHF